MSFGIYVGWVFLWLFVFNSVDCSIIMSLKFWLWVAPYDCLLFCWLVLVFGVRW